MINDTNLEQFGGPDSSNYQSLGNMVVNGLSYPEVRQIFLDLFENNFLKMKEEAGQLVSDRVAQITNSVFEKLFEKSPSSFQEFNKPALQYELFQVQKEYAKSGDSDLQELLVDLLVERAISQSRNMTQLVLNAALNVAPSLTAQHFDALTLQVVLTKIDWTTVRDVANLISRIKHDIEPFTIDFLVEESHYSYLEFQRCGRFKDEILLKSENSFQIHCKRIFLGNLSLPKVKKHLSVCTYKDENAITFIIGMLYSLSLKKISTLNEVDLIKLVADTDPGVDIKLAFDRFFKEVELKPFEVYDLVAKSSKCFDELADFLEKTVYHRFELSSVGIAIAQANFSRRTVKTLNFPE